MKLAIFYTQISNREIQVIQSALATAYKDILDVLIGGELALINEAYNAQRNQYNADILLKYLLATKKEYLVLWVVNKDIYSMNMNFIFGYAMYYKGALLSTYRLSSQMLIEKEAIHEIGHVLGLHHCKHKCVMQFSNSLWEAKIKPSYLCERCKSKVKPL